jgi:4-amino-4-deoxy-L-arabinose transferase-like glycosyltransferase
MPAVLIITLICSSLILWFSAISNITRSRFRKENQRLLWLLIVLFFPILGSILYFQLKRGFVTTERRIFRPDFNRGEA